MPAKVRPEDTFDFDEWVADPKPPLTAVTVSTRNGYKTLVMKAPNVDDDKTAEDLAEKFGDASDDERMLSVIIVALVDGKEPPDLDQFAPPYKSVLNPDQVHRMRNAIFRGGWQKIITAFYSVALANPEPEHPSSPES